MSPTAAEGGAWQRTLLRAGTLGSRRPVVAGAGLAAVALACAVLVVARPAEVVAAIEASEAEPGGAGAAPGETPASGRAEAPKDAPPKKQFATPDELDAADSLPKLVALGETYPEDPAVLKRLAIAHSGEGDHSASIRAVRKLGRISPKVVEEDAIQQVVVRAAGGTPEVQELAFELLLDGMGAAGADLLYTLATTPSTPKAAKERADRALGTEKVRAAASPALLVALDLRAEKNCERKKLFPRARDEGDTRALPFLTPLLATSGCGFLGTGDCLKCLGGRQDLREAIAGIRGREKSGKTP